MSDIKIQSYDDCVKLWYETRKRKLAHNTYLIRGEKDGAIQEFDSYFGIKLHNTVIIKYFFGGDRIGLYTGGWHTVTTKDRINRFSPARVFSERCIWYISHGEYPHFKKYNFHDGILVNKHGIPIDKDEHEYIDETKLIHKLDRMIKVYVNGYIKSIMDSKTFPIPDGGDCWGCLMRPMEEKKYDIRIQPMGYGHFLDHFKEKYYVPSIAMQAISRNANPGFIYQFEKDNIESGKWPDLLERDMLYMFRSIKTNLLNELKAQGE